MTPRTLSTAHPFDLTGAPLAGDQHLVRLGLDLQVDALLFALVGALSHPTTDASAEELPWQRWLDEDLAAAVALGRALVAEGEPLPGVLGTAPASAETTLTDLAVRYRTIAGLLSEVLRGRPGGQEVLAHFERRLADLELLAGPAGTETSATSARERTPAGLRS